MIITLKSGKILLLFFVIALFFLLFLLPQRTGVVSTFPIKDRTIVIDAGHGGMDGGATSGDTLEKNINLSIAKYLESYLKQSGANVVMTRESDMELGENKEGVKNKKREDLKERKSIVNKTAPDVFVSIHQNFFGESKYKGAQVFYETNNINSIKLAQIVQNSMISNLDKSNTRQVAKIPDNKILFQDLKVPAILVECGFLSNKEEAELLKTKEYQQKVAYSIYVGISQYFCQ